MDMSTTEQPIPFIPTSTDRKPNALEIAKVERTQQLLSERIRLLQFHRNQLKKYLTLIQTFDDDEEDDNDDDNEENSTG